MEEPQDAGKYRVEFHGLVQGPVIGDHATVHQHYVSAETSVTPEHVWMVPYRRNGFFTGRETLLSALHDSFTKDRTAVLTQGQAINGLGGIGKTQVAVEYAYRHRDKYRFVLWARAATPETLVSAFVSIADELQLPERTLQEQDKIVAAVQRWLSTHEEWLLIVDNADELAMVWPLLPTGNKGHVLVTTRDQATGDLESFLVEKMDHVEGTLLLLRRAHILKPGMELEQVLLADRQIAEQIVAAMDGLPLALDQAGAYIEETKSDLSTYLECYRARRAVLLGRRGRRDHDHPDSVATTWSLSFERVEQQSAAAADLLRLCAFLAPDAIPEEIITVFMSAITQATKPTLLKRALLWLRQQTGKTASSSSSQRGAKDTFVLDEAISVLRAYSLIRRDPAEQTLSVHRLVQAVLKDAMPDEEQKLWATLAVLAVNAVFPDVEFEIWPQCERCLPHALVCADLVAQGDLMLLEAARLHNKAGYYLYERGRYAEAEPLYMRALRIREEQLGASHPDTATSLNNLASLYRSQGKYSEAEPLYVRALRIREEQLGASHPSTATSLNNLAGLYRSQGKYSLAEPLYVRALSIKEQQLGSDHPDTAQSLNNLAGLYNNQGEYEQAKPLVVRALAITKQQLGPEHPSTAQSLNNLAEIYRSQGKYSEAEPLYIRAQAICEQALGPQHPHTQTARRNYATLLRAMGRDEEAQQLEDPQ